MSVIDRALAKWSKQCEQNEKQRDESKQITKAVCEQPRCEWTYLGRTDERSEIAHARAAGHAYRFGHVVALREDIIDILIDRIRPTRCDEKGGAQD